MGRKSLEKERLIDKDKTRKWVEDLIIRLQDYSLADITIDQLAILMNKSKSTIYQYFTTKDEIIELAVEVHIDQVRDYNNILTDETKDPLSRYKEFLTLMCIGVKGLKPNFLDDLLKHYPKSWARVSQFLMRIISDQRAFYEKGMQQGVFKKVSTTLLSQLDYHFVFDIMIKGEIYSDESIEEMVMDYLHIKFEGLTC